MENSNRKTALITGGSRGLGKNMALALIRKGIDVIFTYRTNKEEADKVVAEIEAAGGRAAAFRLDTGDHKSFDAFLTDVADYQEKCTGKAGFDFLINNAGAAKPGPIAEVTEEDFDLLMNTHFKGVFFLTQKALKYLHGGGGIMNISSGLARYSLPNVSVYASMKGAVEVFTRYLAKELGPRGIRANVVAPGAIETDFGGGRLRTDAAYRGMVSGITALGRPGVPDDIGGVVAFLCTEDARWINGQRIEVSGGANL